MQFAEEEERSRPGGEFYGSSAVILSDRWATKLDSLKTILRERGDTSFIVVSDFDHTLTHFTSEQCHDILGRHEDYSKEFTTEFTEIFNVPRAMDEWFRVAHDCIVDKSGLTSTMLQQRLEQRTITVRNGLREFVSNLREEGVPLVIVSAGIRDVVVHTLTAIEIDTSSDHLFHIDANYCQFHADGQIANILPEHPVHSESKKHAAQRAPHIFSFLSAQASDCDQIEADITIEGLETVTVNTVAIVMGDRPSDFTVLSTFTNVATFRVGFARERDSQDAQALLDEAQCDAVFIGEHGLESVHALVGELISVRKVHKQ
jgi:2-hydroxy-3-keto-5-methylthiopentenyl-1-phosphate phosphatase